MSEDRGQAFTVEWAERNLKEAKSIATTMHTAHNQMYGPLPYEYHLQHVENVIQRFFKSDKPRTWYLRIAAWLHDLVEDTGYGLDTIKRGFGEHVADIVWRVTDEEITEEEIASGIRDNRKNRKAKTYPKTKESEEGTALKLADRIANVENCHSWNNSLLKMYQKEYPEFRNQLYNDSHCSKVKRMWRYLDLLSYPQLVEEHCE